MDSSRGSSEYLHRGRHPSEQTRVSDFRLSKESSYYGRRPEDSALFLLSPQEIEKIENKEQSKQVVMKELFQRSVVFLTAYAR